MESFGLNTHRNIPKHIQHQQHQCFKDAPYNMFFLCIHGYFVTTLLRNYKSN